MLMMQAVEELDYTDIAIDWPEESPVFQSGQRDFKHIKERQNI